MEKQIEICAISAALAPERLAQPVFLKAEATPLIDK
jgi:hypothetical protein